MALTCLYIIVNRTFKFIVYFQGSGSHFESYVHIKLLLSSGLGNSKSCSPLCQPNILSISLACYFSQRYRSNNRKCEDKSNRGLLIHPLLVYSERALFLPRSATEPVQKSAGQYSPNKVPTKLGYK